ncbi:MAG: asparaginase, partial [Pseudomonadota bacterium]
MVARDLSEWCDVDALPAPGIDGCGLPNWPIPLGSLALGFARFAKAAKGADPAVTAIARAMQRHPSLVAGEHRLCTEVMRVMPDVLAKTGAEGVYVAAILDRGLGIALKVHDGATRASRLAIVKVLEALDCIADDKAKRSLGRELRPILKNFAGTPVGHIQLSEETLDELHARLDA